MISRSRAGSRARSSWRRRCAPTTRPPCCPRPPSSASARAHRRKIETFVTFVESFVTSVVKRVEFNRKGHKGIHEGHKDGFVMTQRVFLCFLLVSAAMFTALGV